MSMRFTFLIALVVFILLSCSSGGKTELPRDTAADSLEMAMDTSVGAQGVDTASGADSKIDNAIAFMTIGPLDISSNDLGFFDSKQAEIECEKLGDGWRLPNEAELMMIYEHNEQLGTFKTNYYLGLGYEPDAYNENGDVKMFLRLSIITGEVLMLQGDQELFSVYGVRAVREHK